MFTNSNLRVNLACPFGLFDLPPPSAPSPTPAKSPPDLSDAIEKRMEGNQKRRLSFCANTMSHSPTLRILTQLGRSLYDSGQFALSAFRFEQALLADRQTLLKEIAQAHEKAGDEKSARKHYSNFSRTTRMTPKLGLLRPDY